ncbi:MAG: DNA mismatch repair protein MutS [Deltaproteobacteria bacterium]|nr:DNA mismatch repair protein MutS [Deltaproteobacteria bacterium]
MAQLTPMLRQFMGIKDAFPDAILFFRMGDFYEMFFEDARVAAKILGITLTSRGSFNGKKVPMCGIPHHAYQSYIGKLVDSGWKVAVCEQVEDPKTAKGIVKREVVRVVTPGSLVDEKEFDRKANLFMAAVWGENGVYGLAHADLSTGEFRLTEINSFENLLEELGRIDPAELLLSELDRKTRQKDFSRYRLEILGEETFDPRKADELLKEQLSVRSLIGFGCENMPSGITAAGALVAYLRETQKGFPPHIKEIVTYHMGEFMILDASTCTHLELLKTIRDQSTRGSLCQILDQSVTPMGSRLLKNWISYPLVHADPIQERLAAVARLKDDPALRQALRSELGEIYDMARLNGKIAMKRANARDLLALKASILILPAVKDVISESSSILLSRLGSRLDVLHDVASLIQEAIHEDPPVSIKDGGIIREGYRQELDKLVTLSRDGKSWIAGFAASEKERTGINSLKVGFNKVFGYYIEISKANLNLVPEDYIRKQTLVNGERYITEALKRKEGEVLGAEEKRVALELEIFEEIRSRISLENQRIRETTEIIAWIDALAGLAETAERNNYTHPEINENTDLKIIQGRHPVIEQTVKGEEFVPNDIHMDAEKQQVIILTGPNMAGKSTILRQTALTVLMAQMGSFVPAKKAEIGIVDRIFTRVGASDDLAGGRSTFMVEMNETANILRHSSPRSLVVLDEIGRGTSTYDGLSIAWAVAEALHDRAGKGVRTLFATHYHELTELVTTKNRVKNFNIAVREWNDNIFFLRKLVPGGTSRSYGIQVARIAGLPEGVIARAMEILKNLEGDEVDETGRPRLAHTASKNDKSAQEKCMVQLDLFGSQDRELRKWIEDLNIDNMTPLEALMALNDLKKRIS